MVESSERVFHRQETRRIRRKCAKHHDAKTAENSVKTASFYNIPKININTEYCV